MSSQSLEISWSIDWEPRNHMVFPVIRTEKEPGIPRTLVVGGCQLNGPIEDVEIFKNNNKKKEKMRMSKSRLIVIAILLIIAYMLFSCA